MKKDLRILYVKSKDDNNYPTNWTSLNYDGENFYLGNSKIVIFDYSPKLANKIRYKAEKQHNNKYYYMTKKIIEFKGVDG